MVKTCEAYAKQALRFVQRAGMNDAVVGRECYCAREAGRFAAQRDMKSRRADSQAHTLLEARAYAQTAARWARIVRAGSSCHAAHEDACDTLADAAMNAANCAGYAVEVERGESW